MGGEESVRPARIVEYFVPHGSGGASLSQALFHSAKLALSIWQILKRIQRESSSCESVQIRGKFLLEKNR